MASTYFIRRRRALRRHFGKYLALARLSLTEHWGADFAGSVLGEAPGHFEALLEHLPDAGARAPHLRRFMLTGAEQLALHKAMKSHGKTAEETWMVCRRVAERELFGLPRFVRWLSKTLFFSWFSRWQMKRLAEASKKEPVGDCVFDYVPGDGGRFDFGITYRRCGTHQLMLKQGAADLAPYLCLADIPCSDAFEWGIQRSQTLAQGCTQCDFRFKKGGPTQIAPARWPTAPLRLEPPES